jgi:hypothetical protein
LAPRLAVKAIFPPKVNPSPTQISSFILATSDTAKRALWMKKFVKIRSKKYSN